VPRSERDQHAGREQRGYEDLAARHAERIAEQKLPQTRRDVGRQRQQRSGGEHRRDHHGDRDVGADSGDSRSEDDRHRRDDEAGAGAEGERQPSERGHDEPREHGVGDRFRGVALAVKQDPRAERPARESEHDHLDQRTLADALSKRIDQRVEHQCS